MDIICRKTTCKHNKDFVCLAKKISILNDTQCDTFLGTNKPEIDTSKKLLKSKPPKYHKYRSAGKIKIVCHANCQFNKNGDCHANGITVNDIEKCPYCITFFPYIKK